jgi:hypothetical protein
MELSFHKGRVVPEWFSSDHRAFLFKCLRLEMHFLLRRAVHFVEAQVAQAR